MGVLRPVKLVLTNYPAGQVEEVEVQVNPEDPSAGQRKVPFSGELWIEADDVRAVPPPKYHRLFPGNEVRLRGAYFVRCTDVSTDPAGNVVEVRATYDPATRGGNAPEGRKVKGTIHWISAAEAVPASVRVYEPLFTRENPNDESDGSDWRTALNPGSLQTLEGCFVEKATAGLPAGSTVQFERLGYFCKDPDSKPGAPVFNRTITLKDSWARIEKKDQGGK